MRWALTPALMLLASACGNDAMTPVKVADHLFRIPEAYLADGAQGGMDDGLSAIVNPEAAAPDRIRLAVEPAARLCAYRTPPVIDQLPRACAVARGAGRAVRPGRLTRRLRFPDDPTQYDYHGEDGGVAASCSGNGEGRDGACLAIFAWRDLIWSINFPERHIDHLDEIITRTEKLLDDWSGKPVDKAERGQ